MKIVLDHVGIAVEDLETSLVFFRDALGLEVEQPEDVPSQKVRAQFIAHRPVIAGTIAGDRSGLADFEISRAARSWAAPHHAESR